MAILNCDSIRPTINLGGSDGNAFVLMGYAKTYGRQLGFTPKRIGEIHQEMMAGDYENLITVFDRWFGDYVDLIRP